MLFELAHCHYAPAKAVMPVWGAFGFEGRTYQAPVTYELLPDEWIYSDTVGASDVRQIYVGRRPLSDYDPGEVVLATARKLPSYQSIDFTRFGKGMAALRFGIYAWFNWGDWAAYNEVVGIPTVVGTELEGASPEAKKMLRYAVYNLASDSRAIKGENTNIEFLERGQNGTPLFDTFGEKVGRARSLVIKGESLTEGPRGNTGSFAASRTSNGVRQDVAQGILNRVLAVVTRRLVNPFLDLNFGRRLVKPIGLVPRAVNLTEESRIDEMLLRNGVDLSLAEMRERYGRSAPNDDDDAVTGERPFDPFGGG